MVSNSLTLSPHVEQTAAAITERGIQVDIVGSGAQALERIQQLIPAGARVMTGDSVTLKQIGLGSTTLNGGRWF